MTTLYLVRHGETEENIAGILQGHMPGHLTENGIKGMEELAGKLAGTAFDALLTSDLKRATDSAGILGKKLGLVPRPTSILRERFLGSWTGRRAEELQNLPIPKDVESVEMLYRRALDFLHKISQEYPDQNVLAVSHGFFIRCLRAAFAGVTYREIPSMKNSEYITLSLHKTIQFTTPIHSQEDEAAEA